MSTVWASAQSTYSNAVTSLNAAGYWPMHEVAAAAPGDIETNYGSLGVLGNAYYPDWQTNSGAFIRHVRGPLANGADNAVWFTQPLNNSGSSTNSLFVPRTSPLTTLRAPFTIELWFMVTNQPVFAPNNNFQGDIIAQADTTTSTGFRLYYQDAAGNTNASSRGWNLLFFPQGLQVGVNNSASNVWHHLVYTINSSLVVTGYLDGAVANASGLNPRTLGSGSYVPNAYEPLTIGNGLGNRRGWNGQIAEVAIYTNALSATEIGSHYSIAKNASAGSNDYFNAVTNDNPILYYRMDSMAYTAPDSSTWPSVVNYGKTNGVAVGNGIYSPGTQPGAVNGASYNSTNSLSPSYPSTVGSLDVAPLSGVSSYVDVGNASAYNPAGTTPFTVTAFFRGNPTDTNRVQLIAGHGTNSWQLGLTLGGYLVFNSGTNSTAVVATGTAAGDLVSTMTADDGCWHWVAAVHNGNTNILYLDGVANNTNVVTANNTGNSMDAFIGSDPCYTYNPIGWNNSSVAQPLGVGAQFAGQIGEVAFFTNALSADQIQSLYGAAGVAPFFANGSNPIVSRVGNSVEYTTTAKGSALAYQWYINTVSNYVGATAMTDGGGVSGSSTGTVIITNYTAYYFLVATNNYGSITSQVAVAGGPLMVVGAGKPIWKASQTNVLVLFSDDLDPAAATNTANYSLDNGASILSASLVDLNEVGLTTSTLNPATSYTLTVQNVKSFYNIAQNPSPTNVMVGPYPANLALWVRADTNITTDGNGNVSGWGDMSGNHNDLIGVGGSYNPQFATNTLGERVVRFTGANETFLYANDSSSLKITGDMSVIAVVNPTALSPGNTNGEIVSKTGSTHLNVAAPYDYSIVATNTGARIFRGNDTSGSSSGQSTASSVVSQNTPHIVAFSETGSTVSHYLDAAPAGTSVLGGFDIANCADAGQALYVGCRSDFGNRLNGDISELIVAGSAVSSYDITSLDTYLIKQHNLPIIIVNATPTNIVSSVSGGQLTLSWPSDHTGWMLQAQTNSLSVGIGTNWVNISNSASTNKVVIPINQINGCVFYRLIYQ